MKKAVSIILAVILIVSLASCGGNEESRQEESAMSQNEQSSVTPESSAEESVEESSEESSEEVSEESPYIDGKKLLVFGDSITALGSWGRTAAERLNMYYYNGAMGGITSAQGIDRFPAFAANRGADYITLLFGMNDMIMVAAGKPRVTPEEFAENMKTLVQMVRECGAEPILLTANPLDPGKFWSAQGQSKSMYESVGGDPLAWEEVYNDVTRKVAEETGAYLIDMFAACDGVNYNTLLSDGIHLAAKGNAIFADALCEWFESRYEHDPEAQKVSEEDTYLVLDEGKANICELGADAWYTADKSLLTIKSYGNALHFSNTNGLWPYAEGVPANPVSVSVKDGYLYYNVSTGAVNASIILFFNGSTPSAYTEGTYVVINGKIGAQCTEVGDIGPNQTLKGKIALSKLGIPAQNVKDGRVLITGVKVYVAGKAYEQVTIRELAVGVE